MGTGQSTTKYKVLLLGLDGAGKTSLLYKLRLKNNQADFLETSSFNFEVVTQSYNNVKYELQMWDLSGRKELIPCWRYFYNSMNIDILIYVVSAKEPHRLREAAVNYNRLIYENSMASTQRIVVINSFAIRDSERAFELKEDDVQHQFGGNCKIITINKRDPMLGMRRLFQWIHDIEKKKKKGK